MSERIRRIVNNSTESQNGQVLIIALIFFAIGSVALGGLMTYSASALKQGTTVEKRGLQLYAADAGVESAIWWVYYADHSADPLPSTVGNYKTLPLMNESDINIKHKSYVTYLGKQNGYDTYEARCYSGPNILDNSNRDAAQNGPYELVVSKIAYSIGTISLFNGPNAITVLNGNLNVGNNSIVTSTPTPDEGNIVANGSVTVGDNAVIHGDATVTGTNTITLGSNVQIDGTNTGATLSFATIDTSSYKTQAQVAQNGTLLPASNYSGSNQTYVINNANTHLTGNLNLGNNTSLTVNGNLYLDGSITTGNKIGRAHV
jgi:hypothetical protein